MLDDLHNSGGPIPDVRDAQWSNFAGQVTAMLYVADGSGQGVSAMAAEPLPQPGRGGQVPGSGWLCKSTNHARGHEVSGRLTLPPISAEPCAT